MEKLALTQGSQLQECGALQPTLPRMLSIATTIVTLSQLENFSSFCQKFCLVTIFFPCFLQTINSGCRQSTPQTIFCSTL
jgi:hypothetical protein